MKPSNVATPVAALSQKPVQKNQKSLFNFFSKKAPGEEVKESDTSSAANRVTPAVVNNAVVDLIAEEKDSSSAPQSSQTTRVSETVVSFKESVDEAPSNASNTSAELGKTNEKTALAKNFKGLVTPAPQADVDEITALATTAASSPSLGNKGTTPLESDQLFSRWTGSKNASTTSPLAASPPEQSNASVYSPIKGTASQETLAPESAALTNSSANPLATCIDTSTVIPVPIPPVGRKKQMSKKEKQKEDKAAAAAVAGGTKSKKKSKKDREKTVSTDTAPVAPIGTVNSSKTNATAFEETENASVHAPTDSPLLCQTKSVHGETEQQNDVTAPPPSSSTTPSVWMSELIHTHTATTTAPSTDEEQVCLTNDANVGTAGPSDDMTAIPPKSTDANVKGDGAEATSSSSEGSVIVDTGAVTQVSQDQDTGRPAKRIRKAAKNQNEIESVWATWEQRTEGPPKPIIEIANSDNEEDAMAVDAVLSPYKPSSVKKQKTARSKKTSKASSGSAEGIAGKVPVAPIIEYPPEVQVKITRHRDKMLSLANELKQIEQSPDVCDREIDLDTAIADLVRCIQQEIQLAPSTDGTPTVPTPVSAPSSPASPAALATAPMEDPQSSLTTSENDCPTDALDPSSSRSTPSAPITEAAVAGEDKSSEQKMGVIPNATDDLHALYMPQVKTVVARAIQGSSKPLQELVSLTVATLERILSQLNGVQKRPSEGKDESRDVVGSDVALDGAHEEAVASSSSSAANDDSTVSIEDCTSSSSSSPQPVVVESEEEKEKEASTDLDTEMIAGGEDTDTPAVAVPPQSPLCTAATRTLHDLASSQEELADEIKGLAERKPYGPRQKHSLLFEDEDPVAMYRWEVISTQFFLTKGQQSVLRDVRNMRSKYGLAVKSVSRVLDQTCKVPYDEVKISKEEEGSAKRLSEVEKMKERRREMEVKRLADMEKKKKDEEAKKTKKREKEEADSKKKQQQAEGKEQKNVEKEEKKKQSTEKEQKKTQVLEKQKNVLMSFFKKPASNLSTSAPASTSTGVSAKPSSSITVPAVLLSAAAVGAALEEGVIDVDETQEERKERKRKAFEDALNSGMSMEDILQSHRARYKRLSQLPQFKRKSCRGKKTLTVTIASSSGGNAFDQSIENKYSEVREVSVDNRIRTLQFGEDFRPAYVGTFSKKSDLVRGRTPFSKDESVLNYDFDSEAEWDEEEADGEDIMDSGDEDEEDEDKGNELEYDDMFRRDNDFGSDMDDDDGEVRRAVDCFGDRFERVEIVGPRFVRPEGVCVVHNGRSGLQPFGLLSSSSVASSSSSSSSYRFMPYVSGAGDICDGSDDEERQKEKETDKDMREKTSVSQPFKLATLLQRVSNNDGDSNRLSQYAAVCYGAAASIANPKAIPNLCLLPHLLDARSVEIRKEREEKGKGKVSADTSVDKAAMLEKKSFDDVKLAALMTLVHGSKDGADKLVLNFHKIHPLIPKTQIKKQLLEIAEKSKHADGHGSARWIVKEEVLHRLMKDTATHPPVEFTPPKKQKKRLRPVSLGSTGMGPGETTVSASQGHLGGIAATKPARLSEGDVTSMANLLLRQMRDGGSQSSISLAPAPAPVSTSSSATSATVSTLPLSSSSASSLSSSSSSAAICAAKPNLLQNVTTALPSLESGSGLGSTQKLHVLPSSSIRKKRPAEAPADSAGKMKKMTDFVVKPSTSSATTTSAAIAVSVSVSAPVSTSANSPSPVPASTPMEVICIDDDSIALIETATETAKTTVAEVSSIAVDIPDESSIAVDVAVDASTAMEKDAVAEAPV